MQTIEENIHPQKGYKLHIIPTKKYKTIHIVVKFKEMLQRETITKRALLPYLLQQGTEQYPSERSLQAKLDELYGASLSIDGSKKGDHHILSFRLEIANDRFMNDETSLFDEALEFLKEVIFHAKIKDHQSLERDIFTREKEILRQRIQSIVDDKIAFANMRLIDEMCAGERYAIHALGYEEDLEQIALDQLCDYYASVLLENEVNLYVLGDFQEDAIYEKVTNVFNKPFGKSGQVSAVADHQPMEQQRTGVQEVIEKQDIQQAKLHIGYRTNIVFQDDDYFALQVFNGLFGSFPSSKLFINVREKNSLAYYVSSRLESHKGLMIVLSGIAGEDYEKTRKIIAEQLEAIRKGEFTEEELIETKELIIHQLLETLDHPQGIVELLYQQVIGKKRLTPDEYFEGIRNVTKDEVQQIAEKITKDTIYLLTNKEDPSDE